MIGIDREVPKDRKIFETSTNTSNNPFEDDLDENYTEDLADKISVAKAEGKDYGDLKIQLSFS